IPAGISEQSARPDRAAHFTRPVPDAQCLYQPPVGGDPGAAPSDRVRGQCGRAGAGKVARAVSEAQEHERFHRPLPGAGSPRGRQAGAAVDGRSRHAGRGAAPSLIARSVYTVLTSFPEIAFRCKLTGLSVAAPGGRDVSTRQPEAGEVDPSGPVPSWSQMPYKEEKRCPSPPAKRATC